MARLSVFREGLFVHLREPHISDTPAIQHREATEPGKGRCNRMNLRQTPAKLLVLAMTLLVGCGTTERDWKQAKEANTASGYADFLGKHPQGSHVDEARAAIEEIDWNSAKAKNSTAAYNKYLATYSAGRHAAEAKAAIKALQTAKVVVESIGNLANRLPFAKTVKKALADSGFTVSDSAETTTDLLVRVTTEASAYGSFGRWTKAEVKGQVILTKNGSTVGQAHFAGIAEPYTIILSNSQNANPEDAPFPEAFKKSKFREIVTRLINAAQEK